MNKDSLQKYFFIVGLILISILVFFIFLPFLPEIILAAIFAIALGPIHKTISKKLGGRNGISAFIVVLLFVCIIILPTLFLISQILNESKSLYSQLTDQTNFNYAKIITTAIEDPIQVFFPSFSFDIGEYFGSVTDFIVGHLSDIVSSIFSIATSAVLVFISLFFFLRDGSKFKKTLVDLSPMNDEYDEHIFAKIKISVRSTIGGVIMVAMVQGLLAGIGMKLFGVPNAALWGSVSALASLVPGLGTAIVFVPAIAYMYITGNMAYAIGLLLWGVLIVGLVDNFLGPYLYSRGVKIHQLIMLFAVIGGIALFGPVGFIFGPIIVSLFFALIEIYKNLILGKELS
jgi:predicted PurR-regulated permease PerM